MGLGGQILSDLGIRRIRLLTNTPTHIPALQGFGIEIVEQVRVPIAAVEPIAGEAFFAARFGVASANVKQGSETSLAHLVLEGGVSRCSGWSAFREPRRRRYSLRGRQ